MIGFKSIIRSFSSSAYTNSRVYKSVVNRQLKVQPDYQVGDLRHHKTYVPKEVSKYPAYPYGEARIFKRSDRGLFGGQVIAFGNKVSEMGNRSRRDWLPNVITKTLWSETLNKMIKMKLTARVLRTITKEGGLDNYVTKDKEARIKELGIFGWNLRYDILKAKNLKAQGPNYQIIDSKKVYFVGQYQNKESKLVIGKRKLLETLYPYVKNESIDPLTFGQFNTARSTKTIDQILLECSKYNVDLSAHTI